MLEKKSCICGPQISSLFTLSLPLLNLHSAASALFSVKTRGSCFTPLNTNEMYYDNQLPFVISSWPCKLFCMFTKFELNLQQDVFLTKCWIYKSGQRRRRSDKTHITNEDEKRKQTFHVNSPYSFTLGVWIVSQRFHWELIIDVAKGLIQY